MEGGYMLIRIFIGLAAVMIFGAVGLSILAYRPEIAPIDANSGPPFNPELVAKGEVLASAGNCASCHTIQGGLPYSGGYAIKTGFGTIYSTNITPDIETGIGTWSEAAFSRALHEGVARDGSHLYPVFPYDHFTKISDADVSALYAFLMTREPVLAPDQSNVLPFPLKIRAVQEGWKILFFRSGRFINTTAHTPEWNRGAYIAQGAAHCGACHTPRNVLGAEIRSQQYAGGIVDGLLAPSLTKTNQSLAPWTEEELFVYLRNGVSRLHQAAGGPMEGVIKDGLSKLPDADIHALAVYFSDISEGATRTAETNAVISRWQGLNALDASLSHNPAARLYVTACASCHYNAEDKVNLERPDLAFIDSVRADDPTKLVRVILNGRKAAMPAFGRGFSDADIAMIANYIRTTRTDKAAWPALEAQVKVVRAAGNNQPKAGAPLP
jgi:mono/diheme cytochrome c family protein